jgi:pyruvate,orthophosphate dikinase
MYSNVVLDLEHHMFEEILDDHKDRLDVTVDTALTADDWAAVIKDYKAAVRDAWASPSRRTPRSSCGARSARCSPAG